MITRIPRSLVLAASVWIITVVSVGIATAVAGRTDCFSHGEFRRDDIRWSLSRGCEVYVEGYAWVPMYTMIGE